MSGLVQIPFSAFKLIDLGQSIGLKLYQTLYTDHSEPVGLIAIVQAFGLVRPSDQAVDEFNRKWTKGSSRWRLQETGIEMVSGKSSTTAEIAKTREGESALIVLSFMVEAFGAKVTSDFARRIVDSTPDTLVPIKPRRAQVTNVVGAIECQTTCVSWQAEIHGAQQAVHEQPVIWTADSVLPSRSFDLPVDAMRAFYQALCTVSRFPQDYHCTVKTSLSLTTLFVLAHSICGLQVCVLVNGKVVFGKLAFGSWRVCLERNENEIGQSHRTEIKLGRKLNDIDDLLVIDEVGPLRANRVPIDGIGKAATVGQGLNDSEAKELAALAIGATISILEGLQKEVVDETGDDDASDVSLADPSGASNPSNKAVSGDGDSTPIKARIKTRLEADTISLWWGCSHRSATELLEKSKKALLQQPENVSWLQLRLPRSIIAKIASFEDMEEEGKLRERQRMNHALDRRDFARVTHMLATQLLLISFLQCNDSSKGLLRVRSTCQPQNSVLGRSIRALNKMETIGQSDVLYSWYYWLRGQSCPLPQSNYGFDVIIAEGYLIYRNILLDLNLSPESSELVTIEPGHILSQEQRHSEVRGHDNGYSVLDVPHFQAKLTGPEKLRSRDHTGPLHLAWRIEEGEGFMDLTVDLESRNIEFQISASIYQIVKETWKLHYGDRSIGCNHEEERVGTLTEGEVVDVMSAGALKDQNNPSPWKPLVLLSAHGNDRGQVACLLSAAPDWSGMVRRDACLRCCVTACLQMGLDFLID
ncbi:hypothetical protein SUNI508_13088 [Seiridium unicorne]|uniref:Uncharacterized protein n=1 Tax=Seiridium unicorne TaxID=138068 RepID=A0ABR2VEL4_9PEZI